MIIWIYDTAISPDFINGNMYLSFLFSLTLPTIFHTYIICTYLPILFYLYFVLYLLLK